MGRSLAACILVLAAIFPAAGAELRVLCPNALRAPVLEAARAFVRGSGHKIEFMFASVGAIHKRVASGDAVDVAIGTAQGIDALLGLGRGMENTAAPIARSVLALAVRQGDPKVIVADAQTLAQALRDASSIVYPDAGLGAPGGGQVAELLDRIGMTAEVKEKSRLVADAREVAKRVASGAAQLGIAHMSDIVGVQNVIAIGPLDDPPNAGLVYAAVVVQRAANAEAARAWIASLASPVAKAAFRAAGYAPGE